LKKDEIMKDVKKWVEYSENNEAAYTGLVGDHNYNWANQFKASKTKYREMLKAIVQELEDELNKIPPPSGDDVQTKKKEKEVKQKKVNFKEGVEKLEDVDVDTDEEE
jgi:hypothetical protein